MNRAHTLSSRGATAVWLVLLAAVALSFLLQHALGLPRLAGALAIGIAFFKLRLIGLYFMELRDAPWPLRLVFEAWIVIVAAVLLVMMDGPA